MHSEHVRIVVACLTYNHEKFIAKTLDSFVMQELNEPFHVYVHDDCSTDNTANIIMDYHNKYPHIIKPTLHPKNYYLSSNISVSTHFLFPSIKAEYVALCEGDDFFVSPHKLQKQIDFLDSHQDYSICFHQAARVLNGNNTNCILFPSNDFIKGKNTFTLDDLLKDNFIHTNSCMYRWRFNEVDTPQKLIPDGILPCDHFWHLLHAECGKIGYLDEAMSVYNIHSDGMWQEESRNSSWHLRYAFEQIKLFYEIEQRYSVKQTANLLNTAVRYIVAAFEEDNYEKLLTLLKKHPNLYDEVIKHLSVQGDKDFLPCIKLLLYLKKNEKTISN